MENPTIIEHNSTTGEIIEREMTAVELEHFNSVGADIEKQRLEQEEKLCKKLDAMQKLTALGLEIDDLKALGLG